MKRIHVVAASIAALAVLAGGTFYLGSSNADTKPAAAQPQATPVPVAVIEEREVTTWDEFSGRLEAVERVDVRSRVAGAVKSVHFSEGALVSRGALLVTIDPDPYAAEVDRAEAQVIAAQARVSYTRSERGRAQRLWDESAIARRELDERVNAAQEAEANLRAAQAAFQSARLNLGYTQVRAPVSGRVGRLEVTVGNLVAAGPGAPVLTTLVSVNPMYASFEADEHVVLRALQEGKQGIAVEAETVTNGGKQLRGRLQLIDNQVNTRSGTVRVRAVFDNKDGSLIPGQYVKLRMGRAESRARAAGERACHRNRPEQTLRHRGRPRRQGDLARGDARRHGERPAYRHLGPRARRAHRGQRTAARTAWHAARRTGRAARNRQRVVNLSRFFIDRPIFAGVLSVLILLGGAIALGLLPISEYPEVAPPSVVVRASYPGASPRWSPRPSPRRWKSRSTASRTCCTCPARRRATGR